MILKFGARNFFSFREGIEISFEQSRVEQTSNILCVKGRNGSGKTSALKILPSLSHFCCDSFASKPDEKISIDSFFNNDEPIELYIEFAVQNVKYVYELTITDTEVIKEVISRKKKRLVEVVVRKKNKIEKSVGEFKGLDIVKLRSNASLISTAFQYEIFAIMDIYGVFNSIVSNVTYTGLGDRKPDIDRLSKFYYEVPEKLEFTKNIVAKFDEGISDIQILRRFSPEDNERYYPIFYFDKDHKKFLTFHDQSSGTKTLFKDLLLYHTVIEYGGVLVMDEFDSNLHPFILPELLKFFLDPEINKNNSQLLFTTHNSDIMDFMGKYRTYLIDKEENESYGYRLDEIKGDILRNDRSIAKVYNTGKIGGVPKL